jgi:hypothetical protein
MVRSLLLTIAALFLACGAALAQSTVLSGKVTAPDPDGKSEPLIGATVKVQKGGEFVRGTITDYDGNYRVQLDPGAYDVEISYTGYSTQRITGVRVLTGQINFQDVSMSGTVLSEVVITTFKVPLIEQDKTSTGGTLTSEQIKSLPTRSVNAIVATVAGTTSIDGGDVNIKGSRSNATNYYIDGIRVSGSVPPVQDIEQLQVVTGGLGAEYGDVTGGVISVVTKGPASEYHGTIEGETSEGLDKFGWRLLTANVSGPIWKKKLADGSKRTVVGFRLSGQYNYQKDDDPPAIDVYRVKDDVRARLAANPLRLLNGTIVSSAESLTNDSVNAFGYRPFEGRTDIDITSKLDFRLTNNIDFSVTGTFKDVKNQFTPDGWDILNTPNNPTAYNQRYRGIARFRHRLGSSESSQDAAKANRVAVSNASYQLQFGFERAMGEVYDPYHSDRLFDYGYVGRFDFDFIPVLGPNDAGQIAHLDNFESFQGYTPGNINQALQPYNALANAESYDSYLAQNGRFSQLYDDVWSNMYSNINLIYNQYQRTENDIITITASSSFDLKLGKTGTHSIQFGLLNEQRTDRSWTIAPRGLWNLAELTTNSHFNGLDTNRVIGKAYAPFFGDSVDIYANDYVDLEDNKFYKKVREKLGKDLSEYVNVHSLTPDQLSLDMFSPRELAERGLIDYYGYDYLGNKTPDGITFNDFFTSRDADGVRNFPVAPLRPLYQAAFIKDKFTFNKMIFSLGLRVERFDLNSKVMRDQYSLYQIMNAKDYYATVPGLPSRPGTIGDDFKVYTESEQDLTPKAFRDGNTWYFADGRQANDGNVIFGGGVVSPLLLDTISGDDIFDARFDPNTAFEDYTPQVNWLPRLGFSFPISDEANFFAHYDVLVQRPPSNWQVTPLDYAYFYAPNRTPENNANLRPERVVDYEVGFQQKLNQNSAIKFSAYYRELRAMLQSRVVLYVPVVGRYNTFGNEDFGTVKGFTWQYDLRRSLNTEMRLSYTLQFAEGTGSDAIAQRGIAARGNLRTLFPLNFDERHNLAGIIDYRYGEGKQYNGPRIAGKDILANFGINLQLSAASGRPYTAKIRPSRFGGAGTVGSINGNRLPWRFTADLRVDKSFALAGEGKKPLNLNVYLRVSNVLNRRNILSVYPVTGSPTDDGFLATTEGQSFVENVASQNKSTDAYLASYSWIVRNANNFTLPRRIYVGAAFEF